MSFQALFIMLLLSQSGLAQAYAVYRCYHKVVVLLFSSQCVWDLWCWGNCGAVQQHSLHWKIWCRIL